MSREIKVTVDGITGFKKPKIKFMDDFPSCVSRNCPIKGNSVTLVIEDGCEDVCFTVYIYDEDCGSCPAVARKICLCTPTTKLTNCQKCVGGYVQENCSEKELAQGKVCTPDGCECPKDKPFYNEVLEKCVVCEEDSVHPTNKCLVCKNGEYTAKDCGTGDCNPLTGDCIPNCDDPNARWNPQTEDCECKPGYVDTVNGCQPEPECYPGEDVGPCKECINNEIVDVQCPDGKRCLNGDCVDWPCVDVPCNNGADCGTDCGCKDGECVPCATLSCDECAEVYGCECLNGTCGPVEDPCKNYPCPNDCADRPECGCNEDGDCETVGDDGDDGCDEDDFILSKTNCDEQCRLEAKLTVDKCCPCPEIIIDIKNKLLNKTGTSTGGTTLGFRAGDDNVDLELNDLITLRKNVEGKPLLTNDNNEFVNNQEELTAGDISKIITYNYRGVLSNTLHTENVLVYSNNPLAEDKGFIDDSTHQSTIDIREFDSVVANEVTPEDEFLLKEIVITYTLVTNAKNSRSNCTYLRRKLAEFKYNANDLLDIYKTVETELDSSDCARPEFKWYRGVEATPFRKKYIDKDVDGNYTDWIEEDPRVNSFITDDTAIDQRNDLVSGLDYRVFTECGCNVGELQEAKKDFSCDTVYFCEGCDAQFELTDNCGSKANLLENFVASCRLNRELTGQTIANNYAEEQQVFWTVTATDISGATREFKGIGNWTTGLVWNTEFEFQTDGTTPLASVELRMNHDTCEECVITQVFENQLDDVPYTTDCKISEDRNGNTVKTFIVELGTLPSGVSTAVVQNASVNTAGDIFEIIVSDDASEVILTVTYDGGCTKDQIIPISADCQIEFDTEQDVPECGSSNDLRLKFSQTNTNVAGTTTWTNGLGAVIGVGEEIFINPNLTDGSLNPNYVTPFTVEFVPTDTVFDSVRDIFNVNLSIVETVSPTTGSTANSFTTCGTDDYIISFPVDCDGLVVNYTLSADGLTYTAVVNNGSVDLVVKYDSSGTNIATVTSLSNQSACCVELKPSVFTINWEQGCTVNSFSTMVDQICQGEVVPLSINGEGGCDLVFGVYQSGTNNLVYTQTVNFNGSGTYNLVGLPVGNLDIKLISIGGSNSTDCENVNNAATTVVGILVNSTASVSSEVISCVGNANGTNDFIVRVFDEMGQPTSNAVTVPVTTNNGDGTYTGSVTANTNLNITVQGTSQCVDNTTNLIINCGCTDIGDPTLSSVNYCSGASEVTLTVTNNFAPVYNIEWISFGTQGTPSGDSYIIQNPVGSFNIQARFVDPNTGCSSDYVQVAVTQAANLNVLINNNNSGTETACEADNVVFSGTVSGGSGNYSYSWTKDGNTSVILGVQSSLQLLNVSSANQGQYTLTVTDLNTGCSGTANITLVVEVCDPCLGVNIQVGGTITNETCSSDNTSDGVITLNNISGGASPYLISGDLSTMITTGLSAGDYTFTVTDVNGCSTTETFTVGDSNECCVDPVLPDGTFESCSAVAGTDFPNSNINCSGDWLQGPGTADTWSTPVSANSLRASGCPASPNGGVFAAGGSFNNNTSREGFSTTIEVCDYANYELSFYQTNAGVNTSGSEESFIGDVGNWEVIINGISVNSSNLPFDGFGSQTWSQFTTQFTPSVTGTITIQFIANFVSTAQTANDIYMGIDGITIIKL